MAVQPIPEGFRTITPHIICKDAAGAIEFYKKAFGAEEIARMPGPDGSIMHAELRIGDSALMLAGEFADMGCVGPQALGGSPVTLHLFVKDCDALFNRAVKAGAKVTMPIEDQFWGDRYGKLEDPYGHQWSIATHKYDYSPEEIKQKAAKAFENCG